MTLTPLQQLHLPTVRWLLSGARATGKTTLIGYAWLMEAIENPGRKLYPAEMTDNSPRSREYLLRSIQTTARDLGIKLEVRHSDMSIIAYPNPHLSRDAFDELQRKLPR